jgi:O-antigen/teichoic acid export membrane protein
MIWRQHTPFAIVIIMSYVYRPMYWVPVNKLGFEEKTHLLWRISLVGGLINVGLNLIFLPIFGIYTVVVATFYRIDVHRILWLFS